MSQIFDLTAAGPILKNRYESKPVQTGFFQQRAFLSDVPKDETIGGGPFQIDIKYAAMSTRAATVPTALANGSPDQYKAFSVPNGLYNDYAVVQLSLAAVDQAQGDENAMVKLLTEAFDGAYDTAYESMSLQLFGNGGGARGQLSNAAFATAVATLVNAADAVKFWPGQVLQASPDDGTGGGGVRAGSLTVAGVDYQGGTVTMTGNLSAGIAAIAQNDYFFMTGDYNTGFVGMAGWNPYVAPTATLFFGVNRTANIVGLSGWRVTGNGAAYEDTLTDLAARVCSISVGKPNFKVYVNPIDWAQIAKTQNSKVIYDRASVKGFSMPELSFEALKFMTPAGPADIIADVGQPIGFGQLVDLNFLSLKSNGKICRPSSNWANLQWLPSYTDDLIQTRLVSRAFLACRRPASMGVCKF